MDDTTSMASLHQHCFVPTQLSCQYYFSANITGAPKLLQYPTVHCANTALCQHCFVPTHNITFDEGRFVLGFMRPLRHSVTNSAASTDSCWWQVCETAKAMDVVRSQHSKAEHANTLLSEQVAPESVPRTDGRVCAPYRRPSLCPVPTVVEAPTHHPLPLARSVVGASMGR